MRILGKGPDRVSPEVKTPDGFELALAVLVLVGALQYQTIQGLNEADLSGAHSHAHMAEVEGMYSVLHQAESGGCGHVAKRLCPRGPNPDGRGGITVGGFREHVHGEHSEGPKAANGSRKDAYEKT